MRLCSIINVWVDTLGLLPQVIVNHMKFCDGIIVVWSSMSNRGASDNGTMLRFISVSHWSHEILFIQREPDLISPLNDECQKRNAGIKAALGHGYTHFILADTDEFYFPDQMNKEKKRFESGLNGLVHPLKVYVKSPTLWTNDHTLVPGIQRLNQDTTCGAWPHYPYAYDSEGRAHIDPSRRISHTSGVELSEVYMHHYSYVRKNIDLKIDNSSANLRRSRQVIYDELRDAKPGYVSKLYHQELKECENYFNIIL